MISLELDRYLRQEQLCVRFDWRTHNCAHFVINWVELIEGKTILVDRKSLRDLAALKKQYGSVHAAVTAILKREPMDVKLAQQGDVMLMDGKRDRCHLGINAGRCSAFLPDEGDELMFIPTTLCDAAWKVMPA